MPTCKEGLNLPLPFCSADQLMDLIVHAEKLGYDAVWGNDHVTPPSSVRKSPPGIVPAQMRPFARPGSSDQILPSDQGCGSSFASSGLGGKAGAASSVQAPPLLFFQSFAPKWPRSSAA